MGELLNEDETASQQAKNAGTEGNQTDEGTDQTSKEGENVEKKEDSPYKAQLDEMNARLKEKEDIIAKKDKALEVKNRAIKELKSEKTVSDEEAEMEERVLAKMETRQAEREFKNAVAALTGDETEKALVIQHYEQSIVRTGNVQRDLKSALALANADNLYEMRQAQMRGEVHEDDMASLSSSISAQAPSKTNYKSPVQRQAESFLDAINPKAKKFLQK